MSNLNITVLNGAVGKAERQSFITTAGAMSPTVSGPAIQGTWLPSIEKMKSESKDGKKWADKYVVARFVVPAMLADVPGLGACILSMSAIRTDGETAISVLAEPVTVGADGKVTRKAPGSSVAAPVAAPVVQQADVMAAMRAELAAMIAAATKK